MATQINYLIAILGETIKKIHKDKYDSVLLFETKSGKYFHMYHDQDCCESVTIEDIDGDLMDLIGTPIITAEEVIHEEEENPNSKDDYDTFLRWTFYKFSTIKGYVTLRWLGRSNGYYSIRVSFKEITQEGVDDIISLNLEQNEVIAINNIKLR